MNEDKAITISDPGPLKDNGKLNAVLLVMAGLGVVFFLAGMLLDPRRTWYNFIIDYFFFMALGVAGLVLAAVHYAAGATWSVTVRRVAEGMSAWLPVSLVLSLLLILAIPALYAWDLPEHIHLWHEKHIYLCKKCFMLRQFLSYAIWIWLGMAIVRNSLKQDSTGDTNLYWRNKRLSVIFLLLFALTITFMSVDLLMSLEETWYSTMFPVYIFAGLFLSGYAACVILVIVFRRAGYLAEAVQDYHLRDMGTWLMAFSVFMVYIGFSQYMLIWYANLPLEIGYMIKRSHGGWGYIFVLLPLLKWIVPFVVLMPERWRRNENVLLAVCAGVLIGQWLDLYWIVVPAFSDKFIWFGWIEAGVLMGFAGLFGLALLRFYRRHSLVAHRDPRLEECMKGRYLHV
ncbi:MAG TPA: hypothetical protein VJ417_16315 [Candidatus Glassbacteria bacterium]|nr:hypothetical protein [Candidatus Glassbacteria bacterium]